MRDYGRVFSSFWQSPEIRALSEDGRTLAFYLLTSPHANLIGCYRLPDAYAAEDLQWGIERVREGFRELSESAFVTRDEGTKWVLIHKYMKWNQFENGNVTKAGVKAYEQVPDGDLKLLLAKAFFEFGAHIPEPFAKGLETLLKPFANPEPEPEPEPEPIRSQNQNQSQNRKGGTPPSGGDAPPKPSAATWNAYADAYRKRYGVEPVCNAKVRGQLAHFVTRVPADEAPLIAAWFVGHNSAFYVRKGHAIDSLIADAEKLRTEWATNRQVTATQALQTDRTQTTLNVFGTLIAEAKAMEATNGNLEAA